MKKLTVAVFASLATLIGAQSFAASPEQECQKLKDDHDVIYASKGFCFKDPEAKAKFGNDNCYTTKPKFSEKEQQLHASELHEEDLQAKLEALATSALSFPPYELSSHGTPRTPREFPITSAAGAVREKRERR